MKSKLQALVPQSGQITTKLEAPEQGSYLAKLKVFYPIEDSKKKEAFYKVVVQKGDTLKIIESPYVLSVVSARKMTRKKVTKDGQISYERGYERVDFGGGKVHETDASFIYDDHLELIEKGDSDAQKGACIVVALFEYGSDSDTCEFVQMELFGVAHSYWFKALEDANHSDGKGVRIDVIDHTDNLTQSKAGRDYLDPKLFTEFELVELDSNDIELFEKQVDTQFKELQAWHKL